MKANYLVAAFVVAAVLVGAAVVPNFQKSSSASKPLDGSPVSVKVIKSKPKAQGVDVAQQSASLEVPAGSYQQVLKRLERNAQLGDSRAALGIYLKANACVQAMSSELTDDEIRAYASVGIEPEAVENSISKVLADCKDANPESLSKRGEWLRQAASSGNVEAQLLFATDSQAVVGDARDMLRDPGSVAKYKLDAVKYLSSSAAGGNVDAMARLGSIYRDGILARKDIPISYSYYRAAENVSPGLYGDLLAQMRAQMTADEVLRSEKKASAMSHKCCS
ncbi:hypothetical protein LL963_16520 [Xanthomonas campestris pv. esculenti]|nr:hypothetical protein [Xanthomonas campestris pv. esculenti]